MLKYLKRTVQIIYFLMKKIDKGMKQSDLLIFDVMKSNNTDFKIQKDINSLKKIVNRPDNTKKMNLNVY